MNKKYMLPMGCILAAIPLGARNAKPNVLIIYTDDHGTLDANCYGAEDLYTPNIDQIAAKGVRFTQFYAAPVSSASRACLMTGQFARRAGITGNAGNKGLLPEKETIAEEFKANGYQTACIGKWHLGSDFDYRPLRQGFDHFWGFLGGCIDSYSHFYYWWGPNVHDLWCDDTEIYRPGKFFTEGMLDEARTWLQNRDKDKPFFLYWAVNIPHYPLQPKEKWIEYYHNLENPRRMYAAYLSTFDEYLGELLGFIKAQGLEEDTIIIFQSDNGHTTEIRGLGGGGYCGDYRGGKFSLFEGGIRVPAIISWPGHIPEGEVRNQMAMNIDWFPTLLNLCGIDNAQIDVDGKDITDIINNPSAQSPHDVLFFDFINDQWAVRKGDWKLLNNAIDVLPNDKNKTIDGLFLTNLKKDPTEMKDFKDKYPDKVQELLELRKKFLEGMK